MTHPRFSSPMGAAAVAPMLLVLVGGCAGSQDGASPAYLGSGTSRPATIRSLDKGLCNDHFVEAASFERFWVGTCSDRTTFERPVYFMVFTTASGKRTYLRRYEACVRGRYVQGPRWIALAARTSDEKVLVRAGAEPLPCTNTRLPSR